MLLKERNFYIFSRNSFIPEIPHCSPQCFSLWKTRIIIAILYRKQQLLLPPLKSLTPALLSQPYNESFRCPIRHRFFATRIVYCFSHNHSLMTESLWYEIQWCCCCCFMLWNFIRVIFGLKFPLARNIEIICFTSSAKKNKKKWTTKKLELNIEDFWCYLSLVSRPSEWMGEGKNKTNSNNNNNNNIQ